MIWFIAIVAIFVVFVLCWFIHDMMKTSADLKANGGIEKAYSTLVDGICEYLTIPYFYKDSSNNWFELQGYIRELTTNMNVGQWGIFMQVVKNSISVTYRSKTRIPGVKPLKVEWDFPIDLDQNIMLQIVKEKISNSLPNGLFM